MNYQRLLSILVIYFILVQERENPLILVHDKYSLLRLLEISIKVSLFIYVSAGDTVNLVTSDE